MSGDKAVVRPELFQIIEKADEAISLMVKLSVVNFENYKRVKKLRAEYSLAAENFIKRQKKGS